MNVKVAMGRTYNLGNYESKRIDVGLEQECTGEEIEETFQDLRKQLISWIAELEKVEI